MKNWSIEALNACQYVFSPPTWGEHLKTLAEYPPVQGGTSFDLSNVVQEFLHRSSHVRR